MEYQVVKESHQYDLQKEVRRLIDLGWIPQGGLSVVVIPKMYGDDYIYYQAMIKNRK